MRNRVSYSTRAVTVVPMPRLSCSVSVRWKMAPFAPRIAVRIRSATWSSERLFRDPSSRATKRTAISLATSPAACPPIPSATTKIPRSGTMRKLSSFPERMIPTSLRPAQVICTGRRYASSRWRRATRAPPPTTSTAALPPQPVPFLGGGCWAAGRFGPGLGPGRGVGGCGLGGGAALAPAAAEGTGPGEGTAGGERRRRGREIRGARVRSPQYLSPTTLRDAQRFVSRLEHELHIPEPHRRAWSKRSLPLHPLPVHERAVGGIEVHEHPDPFPALQLGVAGGHGRIGYDEVVVIGPPDVHHRSLHGQALPHEAPASHEEAREQAARGRSGGGRHEGLEAMHGVSEAIRCAGRGRRLARPARLSRPWRRGRGGGHGLRRASGRPRWRGGDRRGRRHVRVEAKLLVAQADHVGPGEDPLTLHALLVHERPVSARIDQQIALRRLDDLSVSTRNVVPRYHDIAPRLATEHQRRPGDHVLAAIREAHDPTARHTDGGRLHVRRSSTKVSS